MRIKYTDIIALFYFLYLSSCSGQEPKVYDLKIEKEKEFSLPLPCNECKIAHASLYKQAGKAYFVTVVKSKEKQPIHFGIAIYDIDTKQIISYNEIDKAIKKYQTLSMGVISLDSIMIHFNAAENQNFYEDSTLVLFNSRGNILTYLPVNNLPIPSIKNTISRDSTVMLFTLFSGNIPYINHNIILPFRRSAVGKAIAQAYPLPTSGSLDIVNNTFTPFKEIVYPNYFLSNRYAKNYAQPRVGISLKNKPIVSFGFSPTIYEYDYLQKKVDRYYVKSFLVDTIFPTKLDNNGEPIHQNAIEKEYGEYIRVIADEFHHQYLYLMSLPIMYGTSNFNDNPRLGAMLLDKDFHKIAEGILPDGFAFYGYMKEGVLLKDIFKTQARKGDSLYFSIAKIIADSSKIVDIGKLKMNTNSNEIDNISGYFTEKFPNILTSNKRVVVITSALNATCEQCLKILLDEIGKSTEKKYAHVYLNLITSDNSLVDGFINNKEINKSKLLIDTSNKYKGFFHLEINPHVYFFENEKLVEKKLITPSNELTVLKQISDYMNE